MTIEEQNKLRVNNQLLLDTLKKMTYVNSEEEKIEEIAGIEESIAKYEEEIVALEEKLNDDENYQRIPSVFQLEEHSSFIDNSNESERKLIYESSQKYKKLQAEATKRLNECNHEVEKLKIEVSDIERRLNKDDLAKKNGIAKNLFLSDEDVEKLNEELKFKNVLIDKGTKVLGFYADEITRLGKLITENEMRISDLNEKEKFLCSLLDSDYSIGRVDYYVQCLDKDELFKKRVALEALKNRLTVVTYDPIAEVERLIKENEVLTSGTIVTASSSEVTLENDEIETSEITEGASKSLIDEITEESLKMKDLDDADKFEKNISESKDFSNVSDGMSVEAESELQEKMNNIIDRVLGNHQEITLSNDDEVEKEVPVEHKLEEPDEKVLQSLLTDDSKNELLYTNDASQELKSQKKEKDFISNWNKWIKQISAATFAIELGDSNDSVSSSSNKETNQKNTDDTLRSDGRKTVILDSPNDLVAVLEEDGDVRYIKYGDTNDVAPNGITINYVGDKMYITYPETKKKDEVEG